MDLAVLIRTNSENLVLSKLCFLHRYLGYSQMGQNQAKFGYLPIPSHPQMGVNDFDWPMDMASAWCLQECCARLMTTQMVTAQQHVCFVSQGFSLVTSQNGKDHDRSWKFKHDENHGFSKPRVLMQNPGFSLRSYYFNRFHRFLVPLLYIYIHTLMRLSRNQSIYGIRNLNIYIYVCMYIYIYTWYTLISIASFFLIIEYFVLRPLNYRKMVIFWH